MELLIAKYWPHLLGITVILAFFLRWGNLRYKAGKDAEKAKRLKEEAKASAEFKKNYNIAINIPDAILNERLRGLRDKK